MSVRRVRSLLAATAVAAVLSYGLAGHGLPQMSSHDGMAGAAAGLCLLLATALGFAAIPTPNAHHTPVSTGGGADRRGFAATCAAGGPGASLSDRAPALPELILL